MNTFVKWLLGIVGVIFLIIGILVFSFIQSMKPDKQEVEKIEKQAKQYIENTFTDETKVYDTLYDNMGNFTYFEYAANVENTRDKTKFLVFYNKATSQMEDSYIADKWEDELERTIRPYLEDKLGQLDELWIFYDERTGIEFNIDPNRPSSYRDYEAKPNIMIFIPRNEDPGDGEIFQEIVTFLKKDAGLKHGGVSLEYIDKGVILEEKRWHEEF